MSWLVALCSYSGGNRCGFECRFLQLWAGSSSAVLGSTGVLCRGAESASCGLCPHSGLCPPRPPGCGRHLPIGVRTTCGSTLQGRRSLSALRGLRPLLLGVQFLHCHSFIRVVFQLFQAESTRDAVPANSIQCRFRAVSGVTMLQHQQQPSWAGNPSSCLMAALECRKQP